MIKNINIEELYIKYLGEHYFAFDEAVKFYPSLYSLLVYFDFLERKIINNEEESKTNWAIGLHSQLDEIDAQYMRSEKTEKQTDFYLHLKSFVRHFIFQHERTQIKTEVQTDKSETVLARKIKVSKNASTRIATMFWWLYNTKSILIDKPELISFIQEKFDISETSLIQTFKDSNFTKRANTFGEFDDFCEKLGIKFNDTKN